MIGRGGSDKVTKNQIDYQERGGVLSIFALDFFSTATATQELVINFALFNSLFLFPSTNHDANPPNNNLLHIAQ